MMQLENLTANFQGVKIEYTDIVNYEIVRENICGYIFLLSRKSKSATPNLMIAAAYTELKQNAKTDPTVIYHLEKALGRLMQLNLLERVS